MQSREAKMIQVIGYKQTIPKTHHAYNKAGLPVIEKDAWALR
jgi:hypothetical protein